MADLTPIPALAPSFATQPGLGELIVKRDIRLLLEEMLDRAIVDVQAAGGAVMFVGQSPFRLRRGEWSELARQRLLELEDQIAHQLAHHPVHLVSIPAPSEIRLSNGPLRLLVNAPLLAGAEVVGTLTLAYTDEALPAFGARSLIGHAAANIGGLARLLNELDSTSRKLTQLDLFFQISQNMVSTLELNRLLVDTTGIATSILNAGAASLMLIDEDRHELVFEIALGEKGAVLLQSRMPMDQGIAGWVANSGQPIIVNNPGQDERFAGQMDSRTGFLTQSIICVPLQIKGKTIGVLEVLNKLSGEGFSREDEQMLMTIAGQAAIAIENARLYQALREERDRIITAQEEVRRSLAENLHSGIVQLLAAISMNIDHIERLLRLKPEAVSSELESVRKLTRQATRQARLLLFELRPVILESRGLMSALESYVEQLTNSDELAVHLDVTRFVGRATFRIETTAFAVIQEAVNNIKRHARAKNAWLRLVSEPERILIEVEDDGLGFRRAELETNDPDRSHFGIANMHERASLIDGTLSVLSLSDGRPRGTLVRLVIPMTKERWIIAPASHHEPAPTDAKEPNTP